MSDELKRKAKQLKKVDGRRNCLRLGQGIRKSLSKIKEQILKSAFFYSIQKMWKMLLRRPKFRIILTKSTLLSFLRRTFRIFQNKGLNNSVFGYVFIITIALIPLLLYGAKYVIDHRTLLERWSAGIEHVKNATTATGKRLIKQCAHKAALEVARKWNPSLSLYEQRDAMYAVADEIYNESPTYVDSMLVRATRGIDVPLEKTSQGKTYEPIKITKMPDADLSPSLRTVEYKEETNNWVRSSGAAVTSLLGCRIFSMFNFFYNFNDRDSALVLEDTITKYAVAFSTSGQYANQNRTKAVTRSTNRSRIASSSLPYHGFSDSTKTSSSKIYRRDNTDDTKVKIEVENDRIKVTTDDDVAYAVPASCNVDIVLGIPVNGAANNVNNLDSNTPTA